jgi:hypothetical protein
MKWVHTGLFSSYTVSFSRNGTLGVHVTNPCLGGEELKTPETVDTYDAPWLLGITSLVHSHAKNGKFND